MPITSISPFARFLPHRIIQAWLDAELSDAILDYAIANESLFTSGRVGRGEGARIDPAIRIVNLTRELGQFRQPLRDRALASLRPLETELGLTHREAVHVEVELAAHGDGAFYKRHLDTHTDNLASSSNSGTRHLTLVTYLHRRPRAFSGGALRYYSIDASASFDVEPEHGTTIAFPSWAPHSVEPVSCPTGRFADRRFAVNIWISV